jgi:transcriptional regulator with XRE-family HTH domain
MGYIETKKEFLSKLKRAREYKKLTQKELGEKIGESESQYNKYEKGNLRLCSETLAKLLNALEIDINYIFLPTMDLNTARINYNKMFHQEDATPIQLISLNNKSLKQIIGLLRTFDEETLEHLIEFLLYYIKEKPTYDIKAINKFMNFFMKK